MDKTNNERLEFSRHHIHMITSPVDMYLVHSLLKGPEDFNQEEDLEIRPSR